MTPSTATAVMVWRIIDAPVAGVILETGMNWLAVIVNLGALIGMGISAWWNGRGHRG